MPDKYSRMIPFFGRNNDDRVKLYLDALNDGWMKDGTLSLAGKEQLKNKYFTNRLPGSRDEDVNQEWDQFAADLVSRFAKTPSAEAINVVKSLAGPLTPVKDENNFFRVIVQNHAKLLDAAGNDITANPTFWANTASMTMVAPSFLTALAASFTGPISDTATAFNYRVDIYFIKKLMESAAEVDSTAVSGFWSDTPVGEEEIIFRKHSDPTKLFKISRDGKEIDVSVSSVSSASKLDRCATTGVKDADGLTCNDYLTKCLIDGRSDNIEACKAYMTSKGFWDVTPQEVADMLPGVAVATLRNFGFKTYRNGKNLEVMQNCSEWLEDLKAKLPDSGATAGVHASISGNPKLTAYLNLIVNKINNSPTILNSSIVGNPNIDLEDMRASFRGTYGASIGLVPGINRAKISEINSNLLRHTDIVRMGLIHLRKASEAKMVLLNGSLFSMGIPFVIGGRTELRGGALVQMVTTPTPQAALPVENASLLKNLFEISIKKLASMGKTLGAADNEQLMRHLEDYRRTEDKLMKAIKYVDKYISLIEVYKQYDRDNILTVDNLKKFVEARTKYFDRTENKLVTVVDLLRNTIDEALNKAEETRQYNTPSLRNM
jgi:hypothetical protein